jgi:hypothetical protein
LADGAARASFSRLPGTFFHKLWGFLGVWGSGLGILDEEIEIEIEKVFL